MIYLGKIGVILIAITVVCTGCWDRAEINDIALMMASSLDLEEDGRYYGLSQIAVPSRQIDNSPQATKSYYVESGIGINVQEIVQHEQPKLSRKLFISQRRVLFIGEKLARKGINDIIDHFSRNSLSRLRTYVLIVKGGEGKDAIMTDYPMEFVPSEAVREIEKQSGGMTATFRDLFNAASGEGIEPVLSAIELTPSPQKPKGSEPVKKTFNLTGTAIFKDLKLLGYLDNHDTQLLHWVTGKLKQGIIIVQLPNKKHNVSVTLIESKGVIAPTVEGSKVKFAIHLKGKGTIDESNTHLDFSDPKNLHLVEKELEQLIRTETEKLIENVQKKYASDIFGFGDTLHKKNKKAWKKLKPQWNESFAEADISVDVDFVVKRAGMTGPSLQLREQEITK
ncbi:Ger(x)C family spore germination protein [Paenibacillus sp. WQ 127069]|uniref:Ger(X)C family spore germination protein n=1 Tax=Paenibacillus baimaensis TaxID=2982185 RepID=A0ABT2US38_9BACL|nr:Ger(x)C family spore germination protein [Paenibacillus sp. WQ 127069]MCU6797478.1 Ger(x)C family spore germination protein [Paenibacillus sp. WQ 127069]